MYIYRYILHTTYIQRKRRMGRSSMLSVLRHMWEKDGLRTTFSAGPSHDPLFSELLGDASWRLEQAGLCIPVWP